MSRWAVVTSEATLCRLALLLLFMKKASALDPLAKNVSQSRRTWCEETTACARCEKKNLPRCLEGAEPLLGADICGCCYSCAAVRDVAESCGSQLSVWSNVFDADPISSVTILATTRCREGLVCLNSVCHDLNANLVHDEPTTSREDHDPTPPSWLKPILASHDDRRLKEAVHFTRKTQPCYAKTEETISSFPFDELLGRVATIDLDGKLFEIVYTGEFRRELEVLLKVVDVSQEDSLADGKLAESLTSGFLRSLFSDEDYPKLQTPTFQDSLVSELTARVSNLETSTSLSDFRNKRELDPPPKNIQEILIRGATAHHEYVGGAQSYVPETEITNRNTETLSQGDESTVRVHITTHPRKVQTLIDLEEGEDAEETDHEDNGEGGMGVWRLTPPEDEQERVSSRVPRPLTKTATTEEDATVKKIAKSMPTGISQVWDETLMTFNDRLTLVEARFDVFERVLEELARGCNLGVLPTTRDCLVPQNSDLSLRRRGPDPEEHLALASGLDTVRFPDNRRRIPNVDLRIKGYRRRNEPRRQNSSRTIVNDGYVAPRRRPASGRLAAGRSATTSSCKNRPNLRSTRDVTLTNPSPVDRVLEPHKGHVDLQPQETQIPMPREAILPSWKMFVFDVKEIRNRGGVERRKRSVRNIEEPELLNGGAEESITQENNRVPRPLIVGDGITGFGNSAVRTASGRLLFRNWDIPQLTPESGTEVALISVNPDQYLPATSYAITNHGNSRIRIEGISNGDYDEGLSQTHEIQSPSSAPEDDFDHIYESVEAEEDGGGFDYDHVGYIDASDVEVMTETPLEPWEKPETESQRGFKSPRDENRKNRRNDDHECDHGRPAKRETPLLLFGSNGGNDPKAIIWLSKWAGYQRDRIQVAEETTLDPRSEKTGPIAITMTKPHTETRTTPESVITGRRDRLTDEGSYAATPKTSGFERRGRKNRRKLG